MKNLKNTMLQNKLKSKKIFENEKKKLKKKINYIKTNLSYSVLPVHLNWDYPI